MAAMRDGRTATRPEFRGVPTRTGRAIMALFGGLFLLPGLISLAVALLGESDAADRVGQCVGGGVFTLVGAYLCAPAFPGVVNRLLGSRIPGLSRCVSWLGAAAPGLLVLIMGLWPILCATGVVPMGDRLGDTPRWVGALAGLPFAAVGLYMLFGARLARRKTKLAKYLIGLLPLLIFSSFAAISSWIAFGPGERGFAEGGSGGLATIWFGSGEEILGRIAFGLGAVFLVLATAVGWWRYLRGNW